MTKKDKAKIQSVHKNFEKNVFTSKKSILVFLVEIMLFSLAVMALRWQDNLGWPLAAFMVSITFAMGFILLVYIGKQSMVDAYTRGMALTGQIPKSFMEKLGIRSGLIEEEEDDGDLDS